MRPRVMVGVVLAIGLLAAELAARWFEPGLGSGGEWPKGRIAEQFDAVRSYAARGTVDVAFVGSSMMQKAIDARLFSRSTGLDGVNVSLPASTNFMLDPWLHDVVVPMLRPEVVVIGVASRDFNDNGNGPDRALASLVSSPGYRSLVDEDWLTRTDRSISRYSALVRRRRALRDLENVMGAVDRRPPPIPRLRCPASSPASERYRIDPTVARYRLTVLRAYSAGGVQTRALLKVIGKLERRGIRVVVLELPASDDYAPLHPDPKANLAEYRAALDGVLEESGVPFVDGTSLEGSRYFRDPIHLNCSGARRITSAIARRWDAIGTDRPTPIDLLP